jgi:double zinc ribbon protein
MVAEALAAVALAAGVLWLVLGPLMRPSTRPLPAEEPLDPEETGKGIALAAIKEIEFDRETGKLSDEDYGFLKAKYTAAALEAIRLDAGTAPPTGEFDDVEAVIAAKVRALRSALAPASSNASAQPVSAGVSCPSCGPRPESDAVFCSSCGRRLPAHTACDRCGATLLPGSRFCEACGRQVAA